MIFGDYCRKYNESAHTCVSDADVSRVPHFFSTESIVDLDISARAWLLTVGFRAIAIVEKTHLGVHIFKFSLADLRVNAKDFQRHSCSDFLLTK